MLIVGCMGKGEETRRQIIERALSLAGQVGLEGVTLGVLADDLQLSKSGLFAHFRSKEALQLSVLDQAMQRFVAEVVLPALKKSRGEPRVCAMFDNYFRWVQTSFGRGGCLFMSLSYEYDDRPGPVRDALVQSQKDWLTTLARACRIAVEEAHFTAGLDCEQFAHEVLSIGMGFHHSLRLLNDPKAAQRAQRAWESLLARCRSPLKSAKRGRT